MKVQRQVNVDLGLGPIADGVYSRHGGQDRVGRLRRRLKGLSCWGCRMQLDTVVVRSPIWRTLSGSPAKRDACPGPTSRRAEPPEGGNSPRASIDLGGSRNGGRSDRRRSRRRSCVGTYAVSAAGSACGRRLARYPGACAGELGRVETIGAAERMKVRGEHSHCRSSRLRHRQESPRLRWSDPVNLKLHRGRRRGLERSRHVLRRDDFRAGRGW